MTIRRVHIHAFIHAGLTFITGLYITSISDNKLIFVDSILTEKAKEYLFSHSVGALLILGVLTLINYFISHWEIMSKNDKLLYDNICQSVFDNFIKHQPTYFNSDFRVSLFMVKKGIYFEEGSWYRPRTGTLLTNVGRHQTMQEKKLSKIEYRPGEGCVGISYLNNLVLFETINVPFDPQNPDPYYDENLQKYNIPKNKSKKLKAKSLSFVSCPIRYFNSNELFGVVVVDCITAHQFASSNFRLIEDVINNFSVFFNKKN
jgi:hypothetical protein